MGFYFSKAAPHPEYPGLGVFLSKATGEITENGRAVTLPLASP